MLLYLLVHGILAIEIVVAGDVGVSVVFVLVAGDVVFAEDVDCWRCGDCRRHCECSRYAWCCDCCIC